MRRILIGPGVVLLVIMAAFIAAFYQFPFRPVAETLAGRVESAFPLRVDFDAIRPGWPFTSYVDRVTISGITGTRPLLQLDRIRIRVNLLSLLSGRVSAVFSGELQGGRVLGSFSFGLFDSGNIHIESNTFDCPAFVLAVPESGFQLQGRLTGNFNTTLRKDAAIEGSAAFKIALGSISGITVPNIPVNQLEFKQILFDMKTQNGQVQVTRLNLDSKLIRLMLTGGISDLRRPVLNLSGRAELGSNSKSALQTPVSIVGPLARPAVRFSGTSSIP